MCIKNKWKTAFLKKLVFFGIAFIISSGIPVQAAEGEIREDILEKETDHLGRVRSVTIEGESSQYTIINEDTAGDAKEEMGSTITVLDQSVKNATVQGIEITLYVLDEGYRKYISIPSGYLQSYSLSGHTYGTVNGESITISGGKIIPAVETWYYHQDPDSGYWISQTNPSGQEGEIVKSEYVYGDSSIVIDKKLVTFHVREYAQFYSEQIMDNYLKANVYSSMTDYEKAETCCKFVAGYDYGTASSSYTGMIVTGSGDCWASTRALLYMLEKLGIEAQSRNASSDPGAGSGHYNVLAVLDGYYYVLEAGYNEKAPRTYSMKRYSSSNLTYIYSVISESEKTICITGYYDFGEKEIHIPSEIDGYIVTQIGDKAFYNSTKLEKVVIPDSVKSIGNGAFQRCGELKMIEIPDSVVSIGRAVFYDDSSLVSIYIPASVEELGGGGMFQSCCSLKKIIVDEKNKHYCSKDGVLFDKSMETLISYPPGKSDAEYHVPEGVTAIGEWAFVSCGEYITEDSYVVNNGFRKLVLPKSLRTIGESAFRYIKIEELQIQYGITVIPSYSFPSADISKVTLPDSVTVIEPYAFYRADLKEILLSNTLTTIGEAAFAGNLKMKTILPKTVQYIGYGAFWLDYAWASMDAKKITGFDNRNNGYVACKSNHISKMEDRAFYGQVSLGVTQGSPMQSYAAKNGIYYVYVDANAKCILKEEWFSLAYDLKTNVKGIQKKMSAAPYSMEQGKDYTLNYKRKQGIANVKGIGYMTGKVTICKEGVQPAKGTVLNSGQNSYKVTKKGSEVAFVKTSSKAKSVKIPKTVKIAGITYKVTSVAANALKNNKTVTKVTIGSNVTSIGKNAFRGCSILNQITMKTTKLKSVGKNALKGINSKAKIKVPSSQLSEYKKLFKGKGQRKKVKIIK